ncbi:IucD Lysine ornithine N-monooxygenase [Pyrenophora tritici-repentis]|uniref:L-ornithine N(5)-monooxygenase n=2 Tax=Pyrenophora tritici-repentis TaxID=45151 RepID=A0A2W1EAN4_9PLEO|nr:L-ornithine 5-monooxygenase (L-ornithine N(5)-oxygenase) [Pyrenophora tritici-repentis Pt-1C-BFP]KAA8615779.1 L-ornithine 5-monooxygenase [Pyrenophora tritici-repentis]EDU51193.1 L-ornithine 5-monooxygenase (L-ornithine N(5)-oxygenase) [Pyrenophora tritici-repentis Pt-1C-BFP]KAF7443636.1 L-ornithine 5-monooxygenase [Pyrenophora tritici-repentis]KAF7566645.1 IucD, Lysine-ornithine N-monooxygenase [Pyrenophora tritici-repentis]KAI0578523.1 L-ornithine 5-monooxygenase (L-ornithine N(5)-oxygena
MSPHAEMSSTSSDGPVPAVQRAFNGFLSHNLEESHFPAFENRSHLRYTPEDELHDLICVGFGPASLAIGVALHDALDGTDPSLADVPGLQSRMPKVAFLEKQSQFAWHAGMLLPGAKMQITFMKDMATMRNPRSEFTFINYLHQKDRLAEFANLGTFLPARVEYEDYMRWCASWFEEVVAYSQEVIQVMPEKSANGEITTFSVISRNTLTGRTETRRTKHVVIAAGGRPNIPAPFPTNHPKVVHSSKFSYISKQLLKDHDAPYSVAVVGNGQSAAEIFDFLHSNYPNARTRLLIKGGALRPSDDSPFVNEIFNPSRTDCTYARAPKLRAATLLEDKGTNYGVVRLDLLEHIYETLYMQRIRYGNTPAEEAHWPHRIMPYRRVVDVSDSPVRPGGVRLQVHDSSPLYFSEKPGAQEQKETLDVDVVFVATGYHRDLHETLLKDARHLMPGGELEGAKWQVQRDYRINFTEKSVADNAGVWLQGCCETTHGLSDTLLSVLATRGGEMVRGIFEKPAMWDNGDVLGGYQARE